MKDIRLTGTTIGAGTVTITSETPVFGYIAAIQWIDGTFDDGVDAVLSTTNTPSGVTQTLYTFTDANVDSFIYPSSTFSSFPTQLVTGTLSLAVTSGGSVKTGGAIVYMSDVPAMVLPLPVELSTSPTIDIGDVTLLAGEAHIGEVTGSTINVAVTPTITAGAYSALDTIGGIQTIANAARATGKPTTLQSIIIKDLAMVSPNFKIWFFNATPGTGTYTDNAALDIDDTDLGLCVGVVNCANGEWVNGLDNGVLYYTNIGLVMTPAATSLFAVIETVDAETFITTSDLTFIYGFYRE